MKRQFTRPGWGSALALIAITVLSGCKSSTHPLSGNQTINGTLLVQIDWTPMDPTDSNMDIGATTPDGFIGAGFVTDPACGHAGDTGFAGGAGPFQERMECIDPAAGTYTLVIENYTNNSQDFLLSVTLDGVNVLDGGGAPLTDMYNLAANTNTNSGTTGCAACDVVFNLP
jgi:hypothetical protein